MSEIGLETKDYGCVLVLGRSGTGKSTLVRKLVARSPRKSKLYTMNVKPDEQSAYETIKNKGAKTNRVFKLNLMDAKTVSEGSLLLIEDIIYLEKKEEKKIREILNYHAHHKRLKVFCISHTVYKTSIWSMLPLFHYILFTGAVSNSPVVRNVLIDFFRLEKKQAERWLEHFGRLARQTSTRKVFYFDCSNMSFGYTESPDLEPPYVVLGVAGDNVDKPLENADAASEKLSSMREAFFKITQDSPCKNRARSLFSIIVAFLPPQAVNEKDLSFRFGRRNASDEEISVSLVDYIVNLIDANGEKPDSKQAALHAFVSRRCNIPKLFKANRHFSSASIAN